jgi:hypothetical protein
MWSTCQAGQAAQSALAVRNVLKRLFGYAIARQRVAFNPAAAIKAALDRHGQTK